jgi:acetyltransferase-like isoleucine patch superfamily enzyme
MNYSIHPQSIVASKKIGNNTRIWAFVNILEGAIIGENCNICDHCFIENDVIIGNNVTVKSGIYIWDGIEIEDNVFLGPNVVFTNDIRPRSKQYIKAVKTLIKHGASIGANSTLLAGITIGEYAMTGIASAITKDVKPYALVYGNPAKQHGWVDESGEKLKSIGDGLWESKKGVLYKEDEKGIKKETGT